MSENSSEGYTGHKKSKKKSSSPVQVASSESNKSKSKNSTPLPQQLQNPSRRLFLKRAAAAGVGVALTGGVAAAIHYSSQGEEEHSTPLGTEVPTAESGLEQYLKTIEQLKALESKYKPGEMPNVEDPEFMEDARNTLKLTYQMCNLALPDWASDSVYDNTEMCWTGEQFVALANNYEKTGKLRSVLEGQVGGVTFGGEDRRIILNTFDPIGIPTLTVKGLGSLSFLRQIATHEWGHYINRQQLVPSEVVFKVDNQPFTSTNGAEFTTMIPIDASPQPSLLSGLNESLVDEEMLKIQTDVGLKVIPNEKYAGYGQKVEELYRLVGQNIAEHKQLLFDLRKEGDPIGIINHFSSFVDKSKGLSEKDKVHWGAATFEFALRGMNPQRDLMLQDPSAISQVAMVAPAPTYTVFF